MTILSDTVLGMAVTAALGTTSFSVIADNTLQQPQALPDFIRGDILHNFYDGNSNDLLTGGLGKTGLASTSPPSACLTSDPTADNLRICAIYTNYRALLDMSAAGGYGVLYGPNIDLQGKDTLGEGKIAGDEYLAYVDDGSGRVNITLLVQIPESFDLANPCIVAAPSSGSRGVYGAISIGEWGLKRGCSVAYTDKGTGSGVHDLAGNTVNLMTGVRAEAEAAGKNANFSAAINNTERAAFNTATPDRFAVKHAHSQLNPEKDWGRDVLQSIQFAFYVLNLQYPAADDSQQPLQRIYPQNTVVIAAGISNSGGASLAAAEQDDKGLIDGAAVIAAQVQPNPLITQLLTIKRGSRVIENHSKAAYDYFTLANLYQPCAALAQSNASAPGRSLIDTSRAQNRCAALKRKGLLDASDSSDQANEAQSILNDNGWEPESNLLGPSLYALQVAPAVAVTLANSYGRFSVLENACGFSYGATDTNGRPAPLPSPALARIFAIGSGIPSTGGINLINNRSAGGPLLNPISVSPSSGLSDYNADGAGCLRQLFTGEDAAAMRVKRGIMEVQRTGNLHEKPAVIVHGRADNVVPVNHASRPYFGLNKIAEGSRGKLVYYEVTNAQNSDALIGAQPLLAGYDTRFIPLQVYGIQALNIIYANLRNGTPLPPSQVVRTTPRGGTPGSANPITAENVQPINPRPLPKDEITFSGTILNIPD